jgi:hypothetical protein
MTTQYEPTEPEFVDQKAMESYKYTTAGKPSDSFLHPVECDFALSGNVTDKMFIRNGPPTDTKLLYDKGFLQVATVGMQADSVNLGELWVAYDVELFMPALPPSGSLSPITSIFTTTANSSAVKVLQGYNADLFCQINQLHLIIDPTDNSLTFPRPGEYLAFEWREYVGGSNGDFTNFLPWPDAQLWTIEGSSPVSVVQSSGSNELVKATAFLITEPETKVTGLAWNGATGTATTVQSRTIIMALPTIPSPLSTTTPTISTLSSRIAMLENVIRTNLKSALPTMDFQPIDIYETKMKASSLSTGDITLMWEYCKSLKSSQQLNYARDLHKFLIVGNAVLPVIQYFELKFGTLLKMLVQTTEL